MATTLEKELLTFGVQGYPPEREAIQKKSAAVWLLWKQQIDQLFLYHTKDHSKLWRIHDNIYDFTQFQHPGGQTFLDITVNTDITELFESSHPNIIKVKGFLNKYKVETTEPLHSRFTNKFTFQSNGFYSTLRQRVFNALPNLPKISYFQSTAFVHDGFLISFLFFAALSILPFSFPHSLYFSYSFAIIAGIFLACLGNASHNYFHLKDNWRMYTIDLTGFSSYEWRISHVYSHHTFSNTLLDLEMWGFEPLINFLPFERKKDPSTAIKAYVGIFVLFPIIGLSAFLKRMVGVLTGSREKRWEYFLPLYLFMVLVYIRGLLHSNGASDVTLSASIGFNIEVVALRALLIYVVCSTAFIHLGLAGAHHHPTIWHAGDNTFEQKDKPIDWGIYQLLAVAFRPSVDESIVLTSITFGRHSMHHLFPTIDLMYYPYLMPILEQTCKEFNVLDLCPLPAKDSSVWAKRRTFTLWQGWLGMLKQAVRYEKDISNFPQLN